LFKTQCEKIALADYSAVRCQTFKHMFRDFFTVNKIVKQLMLRSALSKRQVSSRALKIRRFKSWATTPDCTTSKINEKKPRKKNLFLLF